MISRSMIFSSVSETGFRSLALQRREGFEQQFSVFPVKDNDDLPLPAVLCSGKVGSRGLDGGKWRVWFYLCLND